jgi:hypothetical protein
MMDAVRWSGLALLLILVGVQRFEIAEAFYLPGVAPQDFAVVG